MSSKKLVKVNVNQHSKQCRLNIPSYMWDAIPESGWYELENIDGTLIYAPVISKTDEMGRQLPHINNDRNMRDELIAMRNNDKKREAENKELYSTLSAKVDTSIPLLTAPTAEVKKCIVDPETQENVWADDKNNAVTKNDKDNVVDETDKEDIEINNHTFNWD